MGLSTNSTEASPLRPSHCDDDHGAIYFFVVRSERVIIHAAPTLLVRTTRLFPAPPLSKFPAADLAEKVRRRLACVMLRGKRNELDGRPFENFIICLVLISTFIAFCTLPRNSFHLFLYIQTGEEKIRPLYKKWNF